MSKQVKLLNLATYSTMVSSLAAILIVLSTIIESKTISLSMFIIGIILIIVAAGMLIMFLTTNSREKKKR